MKRRLQHTAKLDARSQAGSEFGKHDLFVESRVRVDPQKMTIEQRQRALAVETDGKTAEDLLESFCWYPWNSGALAQAAAQALNRHLRERPGMSVHFFDILPGVEIEKTIGLLTPQSRRLLLELGAPKPGERRTPATTLSYEYFKAVCRKRLVEAEVNGKRFKYALLPHELMDDSLGMVHQNACAVSEAVPKKLRTVVGYHEFMEGKTGSHKKAVKAEKEAVRSLGLEKEYAEWLRNTGQNREPTESLYS